MEKLLKLNKPPSHPLNPVDVGPHLLQEAEVLQEVLEVEEAEVEHGGPLQEGVI